MIDTLVYVLLAVFFCSQTMPITVNSPNCGHLGTQAFVLYSDSVLYLDVRVISSPICVAITVMLFDIKASRDII